MDIAFDATATLQLTLPASVGSTTPLPAAPRDADFLSVLDRLMSAWFVERDYDEAEGFFSPRCYACVELLHSVPAPVQSEGDARRELREAVRQIAEATDRSPTLSGMIRGAQPWNPELHLMSHDSSREAERFRCIRHGKRQQLRAPRR